jgi:hypothetical protein
VQRRAGARGERAQPRAVLRDQLFVGGHDVFAVRDRAQHEFAREAHAADAFHHDRHLRIVDDRKRIAVPRAPLHVARLRGSRTAMPRSNPGCASSSRRATAAPTTPQPNRPTPCRIVAGRPTFVRFVEIEGGRHRDPP